MASDTSLVFNLVARDRISRALGPVARKLEAFGTRVGTAVAGVGVAAPYVAAAATAAGALAAGAVAAGAAVGAFKAAAVPQLESVTNAWTLYDTAQKAAVQGGAQAAKAQHDYTQAMAQMTPATRATAREFIGLRRDFSTWSDSLSSTTMPIFTRGIQALRGALPSLTPLVKAAGGAIGRFVDDIASGLKSGGFKRWISDFATAAGPALSNFLTVAKNLATGLGALLHAFLPMSSGVTGGLVAMSGAFANWAKHLEGSAGFAKFLDLAASGKGALGNLALALVNVAASLAPFLGATTIVAQALADFIGAVPPSVIAMLAKAFIAASVGMRAWAIATAIWSGIQRVATAVQWAMNSALLASPITWIIIAIVALVAVIVLIATKTTWFQTAWRVAWDAIKSAARATANGVMTVLTWFAKLPGMLANWFGTAAKWAVDKFMGLVRWMGGFPGKMVHAIASLGGKLWGVAKAALDRQNSAIRGGITAAVNLARTLPGKIGKAVGALGRLLYGQGKDVVRGLWSGISSMGGWLRSTLTGWAKSVIPGPIAKALGIASPSKVTKAQGRWIARGLIDGLTGSAAQVRKASQKVADIIRDAMAPGRRRNRILDVIADDTRRLASMADKQASVAKKLKAAQTKLADLVKARADLASKVREGILSGANITSAMDDGGKVTADTLLQRLKGNTAKATAFTTNLNKLKRMGLRGDLVQQIAEAGVEGGSATADALAHASGRQIRDINAQQKALVGVAGRAGNAAGDAMYGAGIHAAQGLVKGLQRQEKAIETQMMRIAKSMQKAIRKALGIASPSRVMAAIGEFVPPGLMVGIRRKTADLSADLSAWAAEVIPGAVHRGTSGASAGGAVSLAPPMGARGGGAGPMVIHLSIGGRDFGQLWVDAGRREVRARGGDVQAVIGQTKKR